MSRKTPQKRKRSEEENASDELADTFSPDTKKQKNEKNAKNNKNAKKDDSSEKKSDPNAITITKPDLVNPQFIVSGKKTYDKRYKLTSLQFTFDKEKKYYFITFSKYVIAKHKSIIKELVEKVKDIFADTDTQVFVDGHSVSLTNNKKAKGENEPLVIDLFYNKAEKGFEIRGNTYNVKETLKNIFHKDGEKAYVWNRKSRVWVVKENCFKKEEVIDKLKAIGATINDNA